MTELLIKSYCKSLQYFSRNRNASKYFDVSSKSRLIDAADTLYGLIDYSIKNKKEVTWLLNFPKEEPLRMEKEGFFDVEISCLIEGESNKISRYNVDVRVNFSHENDLSFHFDLKRGIPKNPEPIYHLHINNRKIPRFAYPPLDIVLLCEFIYINFFPQETKLLRKTTEWKNIVKCSQDLFLSDYFRECYDFIVKDKDTLLANLTQQRIR